MKDALINLQILYEIAMSIGTSLDMKTMLQKSLSTYLRKFSCAAGAILKGTVAGDTVHLERLIAIPRTIENNTIFQAAMKQIPQRIAMDEVGSYLEKLPYAGICEDRYFHIMELPNFGLLVLFKHGSPIEPFLIQSLGPINAKLATACQGCLRKAHIQSIANDLKRENRDRRKAERAVAASHEQLENIFDSLSAIVYVADLDTHEIIFNNRYMSDLFGSNLKGRPCYQVIQGQSQPCRRCGGDTLVDDQGQTLGTVVWEENNPMLARWFMHHSRAIPWKDGRLVRLQISTDITQLKQLEQERIKAAHSEQTQRLQSLGTLAGGVAQEFNNLLMGMMGSLSLMRFEMKDSHPFHLNLGRIEANIHEAAKLTDKLLGYAQKGRYEKRRFQVNPILRGLAKPLPKTYANVKIQLDLDENLHQIKADSRQIEHALLNLLTNACDAMPDGGELMIRTTNSDPGDLVGLPHPPPAESYVRISVQDSGIGMTPEVKAQIFDPFFTTKTIGRGAGLGLAAAYGIFKGHGGFIDVDSTLGQGSKVVVHLPASPKTDPSEVVAETPTLSDKKTVLLVDDEPIVLEIGEQMLWYLGHKVITAKSGLEAIAALEQHRRGIDLVILDVVMPEMSGTETYDRLKAIDAEVKVLISSGFSVEEKVRKILVKGADNFLQKPFSMEELKSKINKAFDGPADENQPQPEA